MKNTEEILKELLFPEHTSWKITGVQLDSVHNEVEVELEYTLPYIEVNDRRYGIYDHRHVRRWRHLDLWQYKTCLTARMPRYRDESGFYHTIDIPWAESGEQMTVLLGEKNIRNPSIHEKSN
jgi:hypothetical protein